jgi:hypothetical protein
LTCVKSKIESAAHAKLLHAILVPKNACRCPKILMRSDDIGPISAKETYRYRLGKNIGNGSSHIGLTITANPPSPGYGKKYVFPQLNTHKNIFAGPSDHIW